MVYVWNLFLLRSTAMCFLAWSAYIWPGTGSSEAICLTAACAPAKIATRSGAACLLEAVSSALAGVARSASWASWQQPM